MGTNPDHWRRLERMYHAGPINQYFLPRIQIGDGQAEVRLDVRPDLFHTAGALHGAVYFKLLDDAAFFAVNSRVEDVFVLTAEMRVELLRPITGGSLIARGHHRGDEGNRILGDSEIKDEQGRLVARGYGRFARSMILLRTVPQYAGP